jgi:hypothetical protein
MKAKPLPPIVELRRMFAVRSDGTLIRKLKTSGPKRPGDVVGSLKPSGYVVVNICGCFYPAHRIVWAICNGFDPVGFDVDHIDRNKTNNRPSNLRLATRSQNCANKPAKGFRLTSRGEFQVRVGKDGAHIYVGTFASQDAARAAYAAVKQNHFGEFSHV